MRRLAQIIVAAFALLVAYLVIRPQYFLEETATIDTTWMFGLAAIRITLGNALIRAANASRLPTFLKIFGVLCIIGGLIVPFIGVDGFKSIFDAVPDAPVIVMRVYWLFILAFFGFIAYALSPPPEDA